MFPLCAEILGKYYGFLFPFQDENKTGESKCTSRRCRQPLEEKVEL